MAVNEEQRKLLNKQLLAAARQGGNVEELLTSEEYRDPDEDFLFDINCTDFSGNTPLHLAYAYLVPSFLLLNYTWSHRMVTVAPMFFRSVLNSSIEDVNHLIEADGCDVDPQNQTGDTPLHIAVKIPDRQTRHAIVSALVETAGAVDSIRLANKAKQTPNDLAKIYCPDDTEVISLTMPPERQLNVMLDEDDIASDVESANSD